MFKNVLVPLDGSKEAERALQYAREIGAQNVRALRVELNPADGGLPMDLPTSQAILLAEHKACESYIDDLTQRLEKEGVPFTPSLRLGDPARCILEEADEHPTDLIVMTTHGRTGLRRFLLGSVAEKIARHAPCPVLLVRGKGENHE